MRVRVKASNGRYYTTPSFHGDDWVIKYAPKRMYVKSVALHKSDDILKELKALGYTIKPTSKMIPQGYQPFEDGNNKCHCFTFDSKGLPPITNIRIKL